DVQQGLERLVAVFERHLRAAPDQWVMFQRVWTDAPTQPIRVFPVGSPLEGNILGPTSEETGPLTSRPERGAASDSSKASAAREPEPSGHFSERTRRGTSESS